MLVTTNIRRFIDNLIAALDKAGGSITIPYLNWVFDRDDLNKLIEKAKVMYGNQ